MTFSKHRLQLKYIPHYFNTNRDTHTSTQ